MKKTMYVLRGVPGSGKSYWITRFFRLLKLVARYEWSGTICSADDYFIRPDGTYEWSPKTIGNAHRWCEKMAEKACRDFEDDIIMIDNTNMKRRDFQYYIDLANKYDYQVKEIVRGGYDEESLKLYAKRNLHGVSYDAVSKMNQRYEE